MTKDFFKSFRAALRAAKAEGKTQVKFICRDTETARILDANVFPLWMFLTEKGEQLSALGKGIAATGDAFEWEFLD